MGTPFHVVLNLFMTFINCISQRVTILSSPLTSSNTGWFEENQIGAYQGGFVTDTNCPSQTKCQLITDNDSLFGFVDLTGFIDIQIEYEWSMVVDSTGDKCELWWAPRTVWDLGSDQWQRLSSLGCSSSSLSYCEGVRRETNLPADIFDHNAEAGLCWWASMQSGDHCYINNIVITGIAATKDPTPQPSPMPTPQPSARPTKQPTNEPSASPTTDSPTLDPTENPTESTMAPSNQPTDLPSSHPTVAPSDHPTVAPSRGPTFEPSTSTTTGSPFPSFSLNVPSNTPFIRTTDAKTTQYVRSLNESNENVNIIKSDEKTLIYAIGIVVTLGLMIICLICCIVFSTRSLKKMDSPKKHKVKPPQIPMVDTRTATNTEKGEAVQNKNNPVTELNKDTNKRSKTNPQFMIPSATIGQANEDSDDSGDSLFDKPGPGQKGTLDMQQDDDCELEIEGVLQFGHDEQEDYEEGPIVQQVTIEGDSEEIEEIVSIHSHETTQGDIFDDNVDTKGALDV